MSADNWTVCPKCVAERQRSHDAAIKAASKSYGKVPAEEYEKAMADARMKASTIPLPDTLREDYEIGTDSEGTFRVSYSCRCTACGFTNNFKHSEPLA